MNDKTGKSPASPQSTEKSQAPVSIASKAMAALAKPNMGYLDGLNEKQRHAVESTQGPVLVLAGAGTGKTRVLITRIAHILATGHAHAGQILAVTFTNRAAREMKERVSACVGSTVEGMPWLGTFHSIGVRLLRRHAGLVGLKSDFTIVDTDDRLQLIKQLLKAENIDDKRFAPRQFGFFIDQCKNRGLQPHEVTSAPKDSHSLKIYTLYQQRLKTLNAVDFGDLLLEVLRLFRDNPEVLESYHQRFRYILVDEYQDTNVAQYLWLRLLTPKHGNICCVGDDDQSIYGWRGAEVGNILRFEKDFPGARVIRLEQNYRSTAHILGAASGLIATNRARLGKELWTQSQRGFKPTIRCAYDSAEEARLVTNSIEDIQRSGENLNTVAVLVRANFQMREFEDCFVAYAIPYRVVGGPRFYERAEIRDANAYFRLANHPHDDLAFGRIINTPRRGLGEATLATLRRYGRAQNLSLFQASQQLVTSDELRPQACRALEKFIHQQQRWHEQMTAPSSSPGDIAGLILDESGYSAMWKQSREATAPGRVENLKELVRSIKSFATFSDYLEHVALVMERDENISEDKITLMTYHSSKGLEFDTVFLPGWEEGVFPHARSLDEGGTAALEEERRLAYVGLTRARKKAHILFSMNRRVHGAYWQRSTPSRFLDELPPEHVVVHDHNGTVEATPVQADTPRAHGKGSHGALSSFERGGQQNTSTGEAGVTMKRLMPAKDSVNLKTGDKVYHKKFGEGRIVEKDGDKLTVNFTRGGVKKVMASFLISYS